MRSETKQDSDIDLSDFDMNNVDDILGIRDGSGTELSTSPTKRQTQLNGSANSTDSPKKRYNSTGSGSEKLSNSWQSRLINSSNDDNYKSLLSNLENTLQSIDALVVSNPSSYHPTTDRMSDSINIVAEIKHSSVITPKRSKNGKTTSKRPRMIHTEKTKTSVNHNKRRSKAHSKSHIESNILQSTTATSINNSTSRSRLNLEDDFEIMSPNSYPPNKISSSPFRIKQELFSSTLTNDLYNTHLLMDGTSLRKELDRFNPCIVNELEDILQSPDKTIIRSKQSSNESSMVKMEPTSPNSLDYVRRSTRPRRPAMSNKYLEFETSPPSSRTSGSINTKIESKPGQSMRTTGLLPDIKTPISITEPLDTSNHLLSTEETIQPAQQPTSRKQQYFECEMCSAIFPDRAQLLDHVPIHI